MEFGTCRWVSHGRGNAARSHPGHGPGPDYSNAPGDKQASLTWYTRRPRVSCVDKCKDLLWTIPVAHHSLVFLRSC